MGDPLQRMEALVDAAVLHAAPIGNPDAVGHRTCVEDQIVVVRAELGMTDRVLL
jgi:hypothetical protein